MSSNYSFYTIPIAYVISLAPNIFAISTYGAATKKAYPMVEPRSFPEMVKNDPALDALTRGRILRGNGAMLNNMENLPMFAAAVVAGNAMGVSATTLNSLSVAYVVLRFVYNHVYIFQDKVPVALRSAIHFSGVGCIMAMFVLAGNMTR